MDLGLDETLLFVKPIDEIRISEINNVVGIKLNETRMYSVGILGVMAPEFKTRIMKIFLLLEKSHTVILA